MASLIIAQGGGPTAVINQTLSGAISAARKLDPSLRILGSRRGVRGLLAKDVVDLTGLSESDLVCLGNTPSAALGSTRDKPDAKATVAVLTALEDMDARGLIYIGGNDTAGTLELLRKESSGDRRFVHAPKTIDNDLMENDHTPGFISAAAFVANAFASVDLDVRAFGGIYVGIVMGRHAGFLCASPIAWQADADDAPHLVYAPERPFKVEQFLEEVAAVYDRLGRCVVSMSEGIQDENGVPLAESLAKASGGAVDRDAHGNVQLTGGDLGLEIQRILKARFAKARTRVDTFGYLPRGFIGTCDATDQREAFAAGVFAAETVMTQTGSVALAFDGERTSPALVPLDAVAARTRHMPETFFAASSLMSDEARRYFQRLLPPRPDLFRPFV
jgi:6-phosphofructokinase 1